MVGEWHDVSFAELVGGRANIIGGPFGSNLTQTDYVPHGIPVVRGSNMGQLGRYIGGEFAYVSANKAKQLSSNQVLPGDIVVTQRGTLGQVSLIPEAPNRAYIVSQSQMGVHVQGADPRFVFYLLRSSLFLEFLNGATIQTGVPHINMGLLRDWRVRVPPHQEQVQIADVLSAVDDKIELNERIAKALEAMARALFKSWFVDFDPVRAKAEGRPSGLSGDLDTPFPDRFGDDGLPVGWRSSVLTELTNLNPQNWNQDNRPRSIKYVDLANTKYGVIEATQVFSIEDAPSRAQRVLRIGDTIVGTVRPGNNSYAYIVSEGLTGSTGFAVLRPKRPAFASLVYLAATARSNIVEASIAFEPELCLHRVRTLFEAVHLTIGPQLGLDLSDTMEFPTRNSRIIRALDFSVPNHPEAAKINSAISRLLGSINGAASALAELSNIPNLRHGGSLDWGTLERQHAVMLGGLCDTLVSFLFEVVWSRPMGATADAGSLPYDELALFNASIDEEYGDVQIVGATFLPSRILYELDNTQYQAARLQWEAEQTPEPAG